MTNKSHRIILLFLLLVVCVCIAIWTTTSNIKCVTVTSQNGVWDLRGIDFDNVNVRLTGDVEYIPNALLSPEEFCTSNNMLLGEIPNDTSYLTSRVRLLVPDDRFLEVAGFSDDFGSRIYLNGKWLTDSGKPGTSRAGNIPSERFFSFTAEPVDGVIEIVQQSSNFVFRNKFRSDVRHKGWTIGISEVVERWTLSYSFSYSVNIGFYVALFLAHLLLFIILPSYRANLWLALLCLSLAVRTGIIWVRPLVVLLQIDWAFALRVEYMTALAGLVFITLAYSVIFPGVLRKSLCTAIYALSCVFLLFYIFADTLLISHMILYCEIISSIWAAYAILRIVSKLPQIDFKQKIIISGLFVILVALVLDTLFYNNFSIPLMHNALMETAVMIFSMFQMTAMFLGTMEEMAAAREAQQKLALENRLAKDSYERIKTHLKEVGGLKHDIRNHLAAMRIYMASGRMEEARSYLEQYAAEAGAVTEAVYHDNYLINAIVGNLLQAAKENGVKVELKLNATPVHIDEPDLYSLLSNILENALEACAVIQDSGKRFIHLTISRREPYLNICCKNSKSGEIISADGKIQTIKAGAGHGYGLWTIKRIIDAYDGIMDIEYDESTFTLIAALKDKL